MYYSVFLTVCFLTEYDTNLELTLIIHNDLTETVHIQLFLFTSKFTLFIRVQLITFDSVFFHKI